jgi:putative molybdopterin biosynthesis protein
MDHPVRTSLRVMRQRLSMQQNDLATQIGVSRQTLSAIESGETVPSTLIALNLARALNCRVEDLFSIGEDAGLLEARFVKDSVAPASSRPSVAASNKVRVALGQVDSQWVARSLDGDAPLALGTPADGIVTLPKGGLPSGTVRVRPLRDMEALRRNLLVAGCDPALGLLGRHLEERFRGPRLHWIEQASRPALEELAEKRVHIAGLHLDAVKAENRNASAVRSRFGAQPMVLVTLASWELGLVSRAGRAPRAVADLARKATRVIGREPGAAAQELLESALKAGGLRLNDIDVVAQARGHRAVAQMVAAGLGDAGLATRAAAVSFGLSFEPLAESRFDLVFNAESATDPRVQAMLDCLSSGRFRKDLGAMTGYRTSKTGDTVQGTPA